MTYDNLKEFHAAGCLANTPWPLTLEEDLNADGTPEIFMGVVSYSRGMTYALFTFESKSNSWRLISEDDSVHSGHLGIRRTSNPNNPQWSDFSSYQPAGNGTVAEFKYTWVKRYTQVVANHPADRPTQVFRIIKHREKSIQSLKDQSPTWSTIRSLSIVPEKRTVSGVTHYSLNCEIDGTGDLKGFAVQADSEDMVFKDFLAAFDELLRTGTIAD